MKFIKVTEYDTGLEMQLNVEYIVCYVPTPDDCTIINSDGDMLRVEESVEEIDNMLGVE